MSQKLLWGLFALVAAGVAIVVLDLGVVAAWSRIDVVPNLEDTQPDGSPYTPSTQSLLRGAHVLDGVTGAEVEIHSGERGNVRLEHGELRFEVVGMPFDQLVPRFHYRPPSGEPDAFDAFNLMLAEYSRNGMSVPHGEPGDAMAHFESSLTEARPYRLNGDYEFVPNADFRPVRFAVINNCLAPGLWELSAQDRSGEIYHSWMRVPDADYFGLVARANGVSVEFARQALQWRTDEVELDLDRLRSLGSDLGTVTASLHRAGRSGYSSQDSRRKISGGYALVEDGDRRVVPQSLEDLTERPVHLSSFVEPGKYSITERRRFDFGFLREVRGATVRQTTAKTHYDWRRKSEPRDDCVEILIDLGDRLIVLGNLPSDLLVPQEDFGIWGFGVGILPSSDLAERRKFLIEDGPPPSFAYLCKRAGDELHAVNSHDFGLEQIFVRTHIDAKDPWWEVTLTSYERIVDLVKYRIAIPRALVAPLRSKAANYSAPLHRTYRDDNLR